MKRTKQHELRLKADYEKIAGETLEIHYYSEDIYSDVVVSGSELACLRLFYYYNNNTQLNSSRSYTAKYSVNLETWVFYVKHN